MKYLKLYEELKKNITTQDVKDCFVDLIDDGFMIYIWFPEGGLKYGAVNIKKQPVSLYKLDDIKEVLLFAVPYLCEEYGLTNLGYNIATNFNRYKFEDINSYTQKDDIYEITWMFDIPSDLNVIHSGNIFI